MTRNNPFISFSPIIVFFSIYIFGITLGKEVLSQEVLLNLPYLIGAGALALACMFNRWRFVSPVIVALLTYAFIRNHLQTSLQEVESLSKFVGLNLLYCSALLLVLILPEKGAFSRVGILYSVCLLLAPALVFGFYPKGVDWTEVLSLFSLFEVGFELPHWFSSGLVTVHLITGVSLLLILVFRKQVAEKAVCLTWLCGVIVFYDFSRPEVSAVAFSALCVALFVMYQMSSYEVTYKDALTGISGRRALEEYLLTLGGRYTVAMLDVDHFKKFNDTYGHDIGDQVLRMVASQVSKVQGGGKAFRYGGEEFTIVFNRNTVDEIHVFLESVRESIQNYKMTLRSEGRSTDKKAGKKLRGQSDAKTEIVSVTISIGSAGSERGLSPQDVIKKADQLLYRAKEAGRNCVIKETV